MPPAKRTKGAAGVCVEGGEADLIVAFETRVGDRGSELLAEQELLRRTEVH